MYTEKQLRANAAGNFRKASQQKPAVHIDDNRPQAAAQAQMIQTLQRSVDEEEPLQGKFAVQRLEEDELMQEKTTQRQTGDDEELMQGKFAAQRLEEDEPMQEKTTQRQTGDEEELMQGKFAAQRLEEDELMQEKTMQRQTGDEEELMQGKFAAQRLEEDELMQEKTTQRQTGDEEELMQGKFTAQRQTEPNLTGMPDGVKQRMETSFGTDFSSVRIHPDSPAAPQVGALAYTQGTDIHFAPGQFNPGTSAGQQLIGHELAHVVQQKTGQVDATTEVGGMPVNDNPALENEADRLGEKAASN